MSFFDIFREEFLNNITLGVSDDVRHSFGKQFFHTVQFFYRDARVKWLSRINVIKDLQVAVFTLS